VDVAYQSIRQAIIEQALAPGTKLREDEIGAHFQMSRTLVRATLSRLQAEGLVESRPKRSARVAQPTLKEAREIFALRKVLEREAVRVVADGWQPSFGAALEGLVREEEAAMADGDERVSIRLAGEFHIKLAGLTDNRLLQRYLGELVSRCSLILATFGRPHSPECAISEHYGLIDALRRGDADAAIEQMDGHIGSVEHRALLSVDAQPDLHSVLSPYTDAVAASASTATFGRGTGR
jgi:DNA-binding GntR family transcriptional regulator